MSTLVTAALIVNASLWSRLGLELQMEIRGSRLFLNDGEGPYQGLLLFESARPSLVIRSLVRAPVSSVGGAPPSLSLVT